MGILMYDQTISCKATAAGFVALPTGEGEVVIETKKFMASVLTIWNVRIMRDFIECG